MNVTELVWKSENFGPSAPCIAVKLAHGTYGVWVALFNREGRATGQARPVGSGCRLTRDEALAGAKSSNLRMGGPSVTGAFQMGGVTG